MKGLFKKLFKGNADTPDATPAKVPGPDQMPAPRPESAIPTPVQTVQLLATDINELLPWMDSCRYRTLPEASAGMNIQGLQYRFQAGPEQDPGKWRVIFLEALAGVPKRLTFPEFERLRGFAEFQKGDTEALGLLVEGNELVFDFATQPTPGFLHALAQPALARLSSPLIPVGANFQTKGAAPTRFTFGAKDPQDLAEDAHLTAFYGENLPEPKRGFQKVETTESRMGMVVVRPAREMQNQRLRQIFMDHIEDVCRRRQHSLPGLFVSDAVEIDKRTPHPRRLKLTQPLQIALPMADTPAARAMEDIVRQALTELGWAFHMERATSEISNKFDIRLVFEPHVPELEPWRVDYLFHSPFGPQLADPTSRLRTAGRELTGKDYMREVLQTLHDDAAVLPLVTCRNAWWTSRDLLIHGRCLEHWKVGPAARE